MREFNHDNVNSFLGACLTAPNICVCFSYCAKASVYRVIQNTDIQLDMSFKSSLIMDLVNGLNFLHDSSIVQHGNLTSNTCMVDSRWVLKVSGYGLAPFRTQEIAQLKDRDEEEYYNAFLWTAPELLRKPDSIALRGTQKGDVYSLGIILQEILFQRKPYFATEDLSAKEIVSRVHKVERPYFRPLIPRDEKDTAHFVNIMLQCWEEEPTDRPSIPTLRRIIKAVNPMKGNVVDAMIKRLEKYASNLEELVQSKTEELIIEKQKTDRLLYRMLPPMVADALKMGHPVQPETFKSVTIYFSDIVEFTSLAARSSAAQVITILNDLYTLFDSTIMTFKVYKVETIGDAYMVVSGAPDRCKDHAVQIANMSLALLESVTHTFNIEHYPDKPLELRIGLHSGPCVAGVVGKTMPRYCLFGDTVNTASRMESSGAALKIHISQETKNLLAESGNFITEERGLQDVKGKGQVRTFWLIGSSQTIP
ncbi:hypothetical protein CAPTEDRAFT_158976 [Capitella teleta]|uniref:Guanylate cyclase n=1 Tax=Capitella teleta TaxID=283909 RepID=R7TML2_CAPTE|nr:hypothetical protein CAPTEDRAFT_158976 [Capitella teleta]|eukprot:ELT94874.1 hypothetical protein CAPTEDRAFT_158976 [Capitella teleta]